MDQRGQGRDPVDAPFAPQTRGQRRPTTSLKEKPVKIAVKVDSQGGYLAFQYVAGYPTALSQWY